MQVKGTTQARMQGNGNGNTEREQKKTCAGARMANREGGKGGTHPTQEDVKKAEGKDFTENMLKNIFSDLHTCKKSRTFATEKKG